MGAMAKVQFRGWSIFAVTYLPWACGCGVLNYELKTITFAGELVCLCKLLLLLLIGVVNMFYCVEMIIVFIQQ